jgi:hypothetical protein
MPGFMRKEDTFYVSYITGPSHVLLGLEFGEVAVSPNVHCEAAQGSCRHGALDELRIVDAVLEGVAEAGVHLRPTKVVYVENDSPRYDLYKYCAYLLAKRVAAGEPFPAPVQGPAN